jgi:PIN domain nuclease of toxin-antitoxin system
MEDSEVWVSAVVAWEVTNKVRSGKWPEARMLAERFLESVRKH